MEVWIFLLREGDLEMSSDVAGGRAGCQVRFEVAVGEFERFLLVGKGVSAAARVRSEASTGASGNGVSAG